MNLFRLWIFVCFFAAAFTGLRPAAAHPMGNFSINHYARFEAQGGQLKLRYVLDFAEIPTVDQMAKLDKNGDGAISPTEKSAYLKREIPQFLRGLSLQLDGKPVALTADNSDLQILTGAGGLPTLLVKMNATVALPQGAQTRVTYADSNFEGRTGWKEIIAVADATRSISDSDAATQDQSRELTVFPVEAGLVPPRQTSASFNIGAANATGATESAPVAAPATPNQTNTNTPQNRFTQSIAQGQLTPTVIAWGLLFAFAFGAVHALSPGHGKTMVAAYLVGSRGTPRHAFLLGVVVTITHTFGVFLLGFALLFASRYILPETLFPVLSALSGLLIFGVGVWLFMSRWQGLQNARHHSHAHDAHTHSHGDETHSHAQDNEEHSHSHDGHTHSHGAHSHSHDDETHSHAHGDETHSHAHDDETHSHAHDDETHSHAHDDEEHSHAHGGHSHDHDEEHSHAHDEEHSHDHGENSHAHDEEYSHAHDEEYSHDHGENSHAHGEEHSHSDEEHSHAHDEHSHAHDEEHSHAHSHGVHVHSHGGKLHSHAVPDGPINMKTLVALGISGGIVPCPEALVVLLAAIKLHRIGYGLILIVAFSLGLAAALIAIGMLVVSARQRLTRFNALGENSALVRYLPLGSAAVIALIGAALTLQATLGRS